MAGRPTEFDFGIDRWQVHRELKPHGHAAFQKEYAA
jgi:hypothetical protein